jgi:hypothetical protein
MVQLKVGSDRRPYVDPLAQGIGARSEPLLDRNSHRKVLTACWRPRFNDMNNSMLHLWATLIH